MRLYKSSEYAIRCLVAMARGGGLHSARALADDLGIPYKYLGRLMARLAGAGLVESVQGKAGGYRIARSAAEIRLADIVEVVEGLESYDRCILGFATCEDANPCPLHTHWSARKQDILEMMRSVTLADMAADGGRRA